MPPKPAVRLTLEYDDDAAAAADALLAVLRAASRPISQIAQQHELDVASPATTPEAPHAQE
jgi:hypothetical protein